ncbi:MAG: hypothetical protein LBG80_13770 [Bacteroidales bacterium]|jgi:hypothetical protein|nr:hypothetical protein [Bacteroidales bacterium]
MIGICLLGILLSCDKENKSDPCTWTTYDANFKQIYLRPPTSNSSLRYIDDRNVEPILMMDFSSLFFYNYRKNTSITVSVTVASCSAGMKSEKIYSASSNRSDVTTYSLLKIPITGMPAEQHSIVLSIKSGPFYMNGSYPGYILWEKKFDTNTYDALNDVLDIKGKFVSDPGGGGKLLKPNIYKNGAFAY